MSLNDWKQGTKTQANSPTTITVTTPKTQTNTLTENDAWQPIQHLKLPFEDKSYLLGAIHALQLNHQQTRGLLQHYADHWERAEQRERHPNRQRNAGRRAANQWLLNGCIGYITRQCY